MWGKGGGKADGLAGLHLQEAEGVFYVWASFCKMSTVSPPIERQLIKDSLCSLSENRHYESPGAHSKNATRLLCYEASRARTRVSKTDRDMRYVEGPGNNSTQDVSGDERETLLVLSCYRADASSISESCF